MPYVQCIDLLAYLSTYTYAKCAEMGHFGLLINQYLLVESTQVYV